MGARGVGLLEGVVLVSIERAEEPPIIDYRRVNRAWKTVRVEPVAVRLVELFVSRVVDKEDIGVGASADGDAIHGVCLVFRTKDIAISLMVEVTHGKMGNQVL